MIKVLEKAVFILGIISAGDRISYTKILNKTGINKATLSNILKSLRDLSMVDRDQQGLFSIGAGAMKLTRKSLLRETIAGAACESARSLLKTTGETIVAATFKGTERYTLAKARTEESMVVNDSFTSIRGFYNTATGRALFAFMTEDQKRAVLREHGMPGDRWDGMKTRKDISQKCAAIRKKGYVSFRARDGLMQYIGVPVVSSAGNICASLGAAVPTIRMNAACEKKIISELEKEAWKMKEALELRGITP